MAIERPTTQIVERPVMSRQEVQEQQQREAAQSLRRVLREESPGNPSTMRLAVLALLRGIGVDVNDDGLKETPTRVVKALLEMTSGYDEKPGEILSTRFKADYDELVILKDIGFTSLCEHHLLPFIGTATVAYIPDEFVVGISKLARITHCFAKRLQLQERMTTQIASAIDDFLNPIGVGVIVKAQHQCMACRGVRQSNSTMVTSAMRGAMRNDGMARTEFLRLSNG
jgi:GTP cyclohydrolase I